ncbi:MAG: hypothetical protein IIA17_10650 [candidate division Zixibacteria bacterium]|nr:hypothetical protein [candidate division Zixibacteria bacterium]
MIYKLVLTISLVLFPILCFGQSALLERGENSIGFGSGMSFTRNVTLRQASLVGSVAGMFDIGYFIGSASINNSPINVSVNGFFGKMHLARNDNKPNEFSANVAIFVQFENVESQSATTYGLSLYRRIRNKNSGVTLPGISIARTVPTNSRQDAVLSYYVDMPMAKRFGENTMLSLSLSFGVTDKQSFVGVAIGISFVLGKKPNKSE